MDDKYWVPHRELVYTPAFLQEDTGTKARYKCDNGDVVEIPSANMSRLNPVRDDQL